MAAPVRATLLSLLRSNQHNGHLTALVSSIVVTFGAIYLHNSSEARAHERLVHAKRQEDGAAVSRRLPPGKVAVPTARARLLSYLGVIVLEQSWSRWVGSQAPRKLTLKMLPKWLGALRQLDFQTFKLLRTCIVLPLMLTAAKNKALPFATCYALPVSVLMGVINGRFYDILSIVFGIVPLFEIFLGPDTTNPTKEEAKELNARLSFRIIPMLWMPFQALFIAWAAWASTRFKFTAMQMAGLVGSVGLMTGVLGINISHELIHKNNALERGLGKCLLSMVCYGHWYIEHLKGHHRRVATEDDPASSKKNESLYAFLPRSIIGSFASALHLQREHLAKVGKSWWDVRHNETLQMTLGSMAISFALYKKWGRRALVLFFGQSAVAILMLEMVNYIEHYGLSRIDLENGVTEKVSVEHSWNADASFTNSVLFKLQRHSDHHAYASRRYQVLRSFAESPQMPTGYAGMLLMSAIPPLWFRVMNKRLEPYERLAALRRREVAMQQQAKQQ